jgi:hypothetical protein
MQKNFSTWLTLGIIGILAVNLVNVVAGLHFGTLYVYPSFVIGSCIIYTLFLTIVTHQLYCKSKAHLPVGKKSIRTGLRSGGDTVIYGTPSGNQQLDSIKLQSGEIRCGNCGFVNDPKAKYCKNCGRKL